ncbi:MAG: GNAT family N-acetyltransferase [Kiritimatiellia bacterium]
MEFKTLLLEDLKSLLPYFQAQSFRLSDYTVGFCYMWLSYAWHSYALVEGCLCIRARLSGVDRFAYPLSLTGNLDEELRALNQIEMWCVKNNTPLILNAIPSDRLCPLTHRYGRDLTLTNPRTWRDYLYKIEDFINYAGKKFSGQRNHVSKFQRLYPTAVYRPMASSDYTVVMSFLRHYSEHQYAKHSFIANEEMHGSEILLKTFDDFSMIGGILEVDGKIVAITFGEISADTLVIHVEKALATYEGAYPTIAHEFAKACARPGLLYINREDDAGDCGLRKSKLQYNPIQILDKYTLVPKRIIEELEAPPIIRTPHLVLQEIKESEAHAYGSLARNIERNKFWGWDWRTEWKEEGDPRDMWFLTLARNDFETRTEISLGIYVEDVFVGECVFHNFTYTNAVELGVRLLPQYERKGYAAEAMRNLADYALCYWGLEKVTAKCYRDNLSSKNMLLKSGLRHDDEDDTFLYFSRTAKN